MAINLTSKKILVIEDHASARETIIHILGSLGARFIVTVESGVDAITAMRADQFDIVLCDYILLGNKTGQQVLEDARHLKLLPVSSIFIMVTGEHRLEVVLSAVDNRPDDYLIKPFSQKQLSSRIESCHARKEYVSSVENEIDSGNLYQAIRNCEQLLQQGDISMRLPLLKMHAELTLKVGDFKAAEEIYQGILRKREIPWARLGLGVVAFWLGNYDQAIETFEGLIEQHSLMLEAYDWLAKTHEFMGNDEHALSSLNSAVTLAPKSILRQKKLALLANKTNNIEAAKRAYIATIELGKNSVHRSSSDYSGLANVYLKSDSANKALEIVYKMNLQFQNDPEAKLRGALLEAEIYKGKGNQTLAQRAYGNALKLNEQVNKQISKELRLEMAKTFYLNGNCATCNDILDDLVRTHIDDKLFIKEIVTMCNAFVGENYAETLIQSLNKELADTNNKGVSLFQAGDIKGAREVFEQAIAKRPDNHTVILNLIKIIIHDIKASKSDPEKIMSAQSYINKAIQVGVPHHQICGLQTELDAIQFKTDQ